MTKKKISKPTTATQLMEALLNWGADPDRESPSDKYLKKHVLIDVHRCLGKHQLNRVIDPKTKKIIGYKGIDKELGPAMPIPNQLKLRKII